MGRGELAVTKASSAIAKLLAKKIHVCCLIFLLMILILLNV